MIESELAAHFEVRRNPVPLFLSCKSVDDSDVWMAKPDQFYLGSYNNCLVETSGSSRKVWLPKLSINREFGIHQKHLKRIEKENQKMWEALEFSVQFIEADFHPFLNSLGALHCMTKELARGENPS